MKCGSIALYGSRVSGQSCMALIPYKKGSIEDGAFLIWRRHHLNPWPVTRGSTESPHPQDVRGDLGLAQASPKGEERMQSMKRDESIPLHYLNPWPVTRGLTESPHPSGCRGRLGTRAPLQTCIQRPLYRCSHLLFPITKPRIFALLQRQNDQEGC